MPAPRPAKSVPDALRIPARTDSEARDRYLRMLRRSLGTVNAAADWRVAPVPGADGQWSTITVPDVIELKRADASRLYLKAMQRFSYGPHPEFEGDRKVNTLEYAYTLTDDPTLERALFSWEWNPNSEVWSDPHLHVGRGDPTVKGFHKHHIPTGRIALEHVLKFAIHGHGVETVVPLEEAMETIDDCLARFNRFRTW